MKYLRIKNWENFQHYSKRNPPWIKLHRDILNDYDFSCLQDASKLHLMLIWLLASQMDNRIPSDPIFIKNKIGVKDDIDFNELINKGFLIDESDMLASCNQSAIPETETETETEYTCHFQQSVDLYNSLADEYRLPKVQKLTSPRKSKLKNRLKDCGGIDGWVIALDEIRKSDFLLGRTTDWKADFDFLLQEKSFTKLMEGSYRNNNRKVSDNGKPKRLDDIAEQTRKIIENGLDG